MAVGDRIDPYRGYSFIVSIDGINSASFSEVSGLENTIDPVEYREGTDELHVRKLSGLRKTSNITCKRGYTDNAELMIWYATGQNGPVQRRNGSIMLVDEVGTGVLRWSFRDGWICKYVGATFNATANEVAIETMEICHEKLEVEVL